MIEAGAFQAELSPADVARLEEAVAPSAVAGTRYVRRGAGIGMRLFFKDW